MTQRSVSAERHPPSAHSHSPIQVLCLTGFMGSGKTTLGAELARACGHDFYDLDRVVEARTGQTIPQIFATQGEPAFRKAEREALAGLLSSAKTSRVVALGGGAYLQAEIQDLLRQHGATTIFLDAPPDELYRRCVDSLDAAPRPLLKDLPSFKKLYSERLPLYQKADVHVSTSAMDVRQVVAKIQDLVKQEAGSVPRRKEP